MVATVQALVRLRRLRGSGEDEMKLLFEVLLFFFTLVTGPTRSSSIRLSDTTVYEPQIPALGTTAHLCKVVVLFSFITLKP